MMSSSDTMNNIISDESLAKRIAIEAIAPLSFTTAGVAVSLGMSAATDLLFTPFPVISAAAGAYALHRTHFYFSTTHPYDSETPFIERRTIDTIVACILAAEATAISAVSSIAPFSEEHLSYHERFADNTALLLLTYAAGKYAFPKLWRKAKNIFTLPLTVRKAIVPAMAGIAYLIYHTTNVHSTNIQPEPAYSEPSAHAVSLEQFVAEKPTIEDIIYTSNVPFKVWPVDVPEDKRIVSSCFEWRPAGAGGGEGTEHHHGIDIRASQGTLILAIGNGTVKEVDHTTGTVLVQHNEGVYSKYLHMDIITVNVGYGVLAGEQLGTVGGRGEKGAKQYKPHLHLQIIDDSLPDAVSTREGYPVLSGNINPLYLLSASLDYRVVPTRGCSAQGGPFKFIDDMEAFDNPERVHVLHRDALQTIRDKYGKIVDAAAQKYGIAPSQLYALIAVESGGINGAQSFLGASGLMQFIPSTAHTSGLCDNRFCHGRDERGIPEKAIPAGAGLYWQLLHTYAGYTDHVAFAAAAYNSGTDFINKAIALTGKSDPSWEEVSAIITPNAVKKIGSRAWFQRTTAEQRANEVKSHVRRFRAFEEEYKKANRQL